VRAAWTTLTRNNGHYGGPDSVWIVEKWTRESIVIRRTDYRPYAGVAVLTGRLPQQGDSIEKWDSYGARERSGARADGAAPDSANTKSANLVSADPVSANSGYANSGCAVAAGFC
jgi:hypothetical protein